MTGREADPELPPEVEVDLTPARLSARNKVRADLHEAEKRHA